MVQLIGAGNIARKTFEGNARLAAMVPAEAMAKAAADADKPARKTFGFVTAFLGQAVSLLCIAGLFSGLLAIMDKRVGFTRVVGAVSYAWFPVAVVGGALMLITIVLSSDRASLDPQNLVATNVSLFLSDETSKTLRTFLGTLDLLSFARIGLLSLALSKVAQIPLKHALGLVVGLWAVWVVIRVGFSLIF